MGYDAASWEREGFRIVGDRAFRVLRPQATGPSEMAEETLLAQIRTLAQQTGWQVYHTRDSRKSDAGFPDLVLAKPGTPGRLIFAECKRRSGKLTLEQARWLDILGKTVADVEVYTWKPADWDAIVGILCPATRQKGARCE